MSGVGPAGRTGGRETRHDRRHDRNDLSSAAQEYLLALRVIAVDGRHVTAAQVGRHLGVTPQAASEMFRRLVADGLVSQADGRELILTDAGRAAADAIFRRHALPEWLLTVLARSKSLASLPLDGPRGRATLGLRPASLIHVLPGEADPSLFHRVPAARP